MKNKLYILLCCCLLAGWTSAQETMYVPEGALLYFGSNSPAGVFGYLRNNGNLSMQQNAQVFFLGKIWINENKSNITDEGTMQNSLKGGTVHFVQPNPVYGNLGQQILHPGFTDSLLSGPCFTNITIDNNAGVIITSDMNVINNVHFRRGHVYLNNYNFIIGDSVNSGKITGYDESRYFVTGLNSKGGYLKYRSVLSGLRAVFPVGPTSKVYAPLQILNRGAADQFFARAFEKVYTNAVDGPVLMDSTLQVTWSIAKLSPSNSDIVVTLQNDMAIEDPVFRAHREKSYVSLYGNNKWDRLPYPLEPQMPGNISSSFSNASSIMNSRNLVLGNTPLFLTKKVTRAGKSFEIPNVFSPNGDNINDRWNIKGLRDYDNCVVEIYNRYGQMLFRSVGYGQSWDGTHKGSPLPVATYYYVINLRNGDRPIGGSVTILR